MLREARVQTAIRCQLIDLPLAPARWLLGTRSQGGVTERSGLIGMAVQATVWAAIPNRIAYFDSLNLEILPVR
jgi:hypothetical protein